MVDPRKKEGLTITNSLAVNLECPVCYDLFTPPIYQCQNGHSLCNQCSERNANWPECRSSLAAKIQNRSLERMLESIQAPCKFPNWDKVVTLFERKQHEEVCEFNPNFSCVVNDCKWIGSDLVEHLKADHDVKVFQMGAQGGLRGWNSKTWKNADWGFSIWNFDTVNIINKSNSTGEVFYLYLYDMDKTRHTLRLVAKERDSEVVFTIRTVSIRGYHDGITSLAFHLSLKEAENFLLEPAEGLEDGYKRLSINIELLD